METLKLEKRNTLMIAHRGLCGFERENTLAAFVAAGNHSYIGCECDIHPTLDKKYVVIHDSNTERVSGIAKIVEETPYDELKQIELLNLQTGIKDSSLRIPTLEEYVLCCKRYNKLCIIEFKNEFAKEDVFNVIQIITSLEYLDSCIFISFYYQNLLYVQEYNKNLPCQFLLSELTDEALKICIEYHMDIDINFHNISKEQVELIHSHGLKVNVWTVNTIEDGNRMVEYGVDYITTNILE